MTTHDSAPADTRADQPAQAANARGDGVQRRAIDDVTRYQMRDEIVHRLRSQGWSRIDAECEAEDRIERLTLPTHPNPGSLKMTDELRAVVAKMTPGEWQIEPDLCHFSTLSTVVANKIRVADTCAKYPAIEDDAAGIVYLKNNALALADEIDRLRAELAAVNDEIVRLREALGALSVAGEVLLEYEGSQEIGLTPDYGSVGREVAQQLMAALQEAIAALTETEHG